MKTKDKDSKASELTGPERRIAALRATVAEQATRPRCTTIRRDGQPCMQPQHRKHAPHCVHHSGGERVRLSGKARERSQARRRAWRVRWQVIKAAPDALTRTPEWTRAASYGLARVRYVLCLAWDARQVGDLAPWREACADLDRTIAQCEYRRSLGHSGGPAKAGST